MQKQPFYSNSIVLALTACILWSTAFASIKIGLKYTTPLQFAGIRFMLSGLIILPFCRNSKTEFGKVLLNYRKVLLITLFQTTLLYTFFYLGLSKVPAAFGAIVVGAGPLFVALLAHYFTNNNPLSYRKIVAMFIGFSGIVLLALTKDSNIHNRTQVLLGLGILIVSNICGSYGNILISKNKTGISPIFLTSVQIFTGGLFILILSFFVEGFAFGTKPLEYYLSLTWLSFVSAVGFSLWFIILMRPGVKVSEINVWKFIIPVLGALLSWLTIAEEKPQWNTLIGMLLIALAVVIIYLKKQLVNNNPHLSHK